MCCVWVYDYQSLIAGGLGLAAGVIAYVGALKAAKRQVAAIQSQIEDTQAARRQADERLRSVIEWSVRAEGRRLKAAVWARRGRMLPSAPQKTDRSPRELVIASSPLLRGERKDMALLDDTMRRRLEEVGKAIDDYNACIEAGGLVIGGTMITPQTLELFARLEHLAGTLARAPDRPAAAEVEKAAYI